jgi:hypothetical protein
MAIAPPTMRRRGVNRACCAVGNSAPASDMSSAMKVVLSLLMNISLETDWTKFLLMISIPSRDAMHQYAPPDPNRSLNALRSLPKMSRMKY